MFTTMPFMHRDSSHTVMGGWEPRLDFEAGVPVRLGSRGSSGHTVMGGWKPRLGYEAGDQLAINLSPLCGKEHQVSDQSTSPPIPGIGGLGFR